MIFSTKHRLQWKTTIPLLFLLLATVSLTASNPLIDSLSQLIDESKGNDEALAVNYYELAKAYFDDNLYAQAIPTFEQTVKLAKTTGQHEIMLKAIHKIGFAHNRRGENEKSLNYFLKGWHTADSLGIKEQEAHFLYSLADYFRLQHLVDPAIEYLDKAAIVYQELGMREELCGKISYTKASIYKISKKKSDNWKAVEIYEGMLKNDCKALLSEFVQAKIYNNLGSTYVFLGEMEKGEKNLNAAMALKQKLGKKQSLAYTLNELSSMYLFQEKFEASLQYAKEAYSIARFGENIHLTYDILDNLTLASKEAGYFAEAIDYMSNSNSLRDSIQNTERTEAIAELELKYNTAKKEQEIAQQELELRLQKNRFRNLLLIGSLLLFIGISIFLWYRNRLKTKEIEAKNLEEIDRLKTRYFTNISHELRTPLSLVIDPLNQLLTNKPRKDQTKLLQTANHHAKRMQRLVNQMLDMEKLESGMLTLEAQSGKVEPFLHTILAAFHTEARRSRIELKFESYAPNLELYYDEDKLEKIVYNLLSNALKFTPAGGSVTIQLTQRRKEAEIVIKDTGVGIPPDKIPFIFDRFFQVDDSQTRPYEGTGIGLSLAKELVELHHGQLFAKSTVGQGTSIILRLPLGHAHLTPHEIKQIQVMTFSLPENNQRKNLVGDFTLDQPTPTSSSLPPAQKEIPVLLLIEDNLALRKYLAEQLSKNFRVLEAENGLEGEKIALEKIPDLIISDIMMPGNGYEVCKSLKNDERTSHVPIILLTAKTTREEKLAGLELQADDYLTKPFDGQELQARINNLIKQRRLLQQKYAQIGGKPSNTSAPKLGTKDEAFLVKLVELIQERIDDETLNIEVLSQAVHMSRSQLHRKLKALTGYTPTLFLRKIRLEKGRELLEAGEGNVSQVAYAVGFKDSSYFTKCFKETFGILPREVSNLQS